METYVYYFKSDSTCEPIGRINASSLDEALLHVIEIKRLPESAINHLFEIKCVDDHEKCI